MAIATGAGGTLVKHSTVMLQTLGMWDVDDTPGGQCLAGVRDSSKQAQKEAVKKGQDGCRNAWHPRCKCKTAHNNKQQFSSILKEMSELGCGMFLC